MGRKVLIAAALVALAITGGSAVAASRWVITSTHQIKPSVLQLLRGARGPAGSVGQQGVAGSQGPQGPAGGFSTANVSVIQGAPVFLCASGGAQQCNVGGGYAACPPGGVAVGGGWSGPVVDTTTGYNYPISTDSAWEVIMSSNAAISESFTPYAVCAVGTGASIARARRGTSAARVAADVAAVRARLANSQ